MKAEGKKRIFRTGPLLVAVILFGLLLRAVYLGEIRQTPEFSHPGLDAAYHLYWARGLATGDWTSFEGREDPQIYRFPYYRPPGYAYLLALIFRLCGPGPLWPRIFQFTLGLGSALLLFRFTRRFFDEITGLLAALGAAVYWIFIYYEGELAGTAVSVFLIVLFADLLAVAARRRSFIGYLSAGLSLGVLVLFRPNAALLLPAGAAWLVWRSRRRREKIRSAALVAGLLLGIGAAVLPVTIRNYAVSGELVPIATTAGISLGVANNELSDGTTHFIPGIGNIGSPFDWPRIVRRLEAELGRPLGHGAASDYLSRQVLRFALRSPGVFLRLSGRKALLFWGPREIRNLREIHYARLHSPLLRSLPGNFSLVLSLAILGGGLLFLGPGRKRGRGELPAGCEGGALIATLIAAYFLSLLPFAAGARYRVPVIPFLIVLAASGVRRIIALIAARQWPKALAAVTGGAAIYLLCSINYAGFQPSPEKWHYDRGLAWLEAGGWEEAVFEFNRALEFQPAYAAAFTNRGVAFQKGGDPAAAAASYRRSLELDPDSPRALKNLADLLRGEGELEEAIALYRRALEIAPEYSGIVPDLAGALAGAGRSGEAAELFREVLRARPDTFPARLGLGNLLMEEGDLAGAREEYRAALRINPYSAPVRYNLANVLVEEGRVEEGIAQYREVIRRHPGYTDAHNNLGAQLAVRGDLEEALGHFAAAIRSDPADPAGYFNRGVALILIGRPGEAVLDLEKTLELSPDYEPARRALAVAAAGRDE